jgi:hypothetical protein
MKTLAFAFVFLPILIFSQVEKIKFVSTDFEYEGYCEINESGIFELADGRLAFQNNSENVNAGATCHAKIYDKVGQVVWIYTNLNPKKQYPCASDDFQEMTLLDPRYFVFSAGKRDPRIFKWTKE